MKYAFAAIALAAAASAQSLDILPECARACVREVADAQNCDATDVSCLCRGIQDPSVTDCGLRECGPDQLLGELLPAVIQLCPEIATQSFSIPEPPATTDASSDIASTTVTETATVTSTTGTDTASETDTTSGTETESETVSETTIDTTVTTTFTDSTGGESTVTETSPLTTSTSTEDGDSGAARVGSGGALAMLVAAAMAL
ncbi:hypothetical protein B0I35DRAFT_482274 [Stachybotrys elegans]|uniref:CFEM domain-containing protein n=1 Tax=Stachybotrys elegans TaxID=80388 RepID=A0A8K0WMY4_9HYPO|nr:hypothetical protein B0I35DRAFT_482274 [Stachybotrys elegans]